MQQVQATAGDGPQTRFVYDGRLGELYVIFIRNLLLTIITLGIYRFWAKTRVRRYLWSHTSLFGDRFEYTGTGRELFLGFLIAFALLVVLVGLVAGTGYLFGEVFVSIALAALYALLAYLFFVARFSALRYRLSRTRWRGIRGGLSGSAWRFGFISMGWNLLNLLAAGLLSPVVTVQTLSYRLRNARFGTAPATFDAAPGDLYGRFLGFYFGSIAIGLIAFGAIAAVFAGTGLLGEIAYLFEDVLAGDEPSARLQFLLVMGIYVAIGLIGLAILPLLCWYDSFLYNYFLGRTAIAGLTFSGSVTTWGMFGYFVVNILILVFTLGLGFPWVMHRVMNFIVANVSVQGALEAETVRQSRLASPSTGEGLLEMLDTGVI